MRLVRALLRLAYTLTIAPIVLYTRAAIALFRALLPL